jgi:hypothetical protein
MRHRAVRTGCALLVLSAALPVAAAELTECVKFAVQADGAASLTNLCTDRVNLTYCIDNPSSPRTCSNTPLGVTTRAGAINRAILHGRRRRISAGPPAPIRRRRSAETGARQPFLCPRPA